VHVPPFLLVRLQSSNVWQLARTRLTSASKEREKFGHLAIKDISWMHGACTFYRGTEYKDMWHYKMEELFLIKKMALLGLF